MKNELKIQHLAPYFSHKLQMVDDRKVLCNLAVLHNDCVEVEYQFNVGHYELNFEDIKPILRPLSDMTEEEKSTLKGVMKDSFKGENLLPIIKSGALTNLFFNKGNPSIVLWLLKQGFDLFGLIESDQAIDKTTLKL